jgi:hypothetical protein
MITPPAILPGHPALSLARHRRGRLAGAVSLALLGFTGSACSADSPAGPAPATPTPTPVATIASPASTAKQQAIDAYLGMWRDVAAAATTSDWQSPRLAEHATGDALQVLSRQLYADHYNGLISKGAPSNAPVAKSVDSPYAPKGVLIGDCSDASHWLKYRGDTGQPADDAPGGKHLINAEVKLGVDGTWRVTRFAVEGTGSC